MALRIAVDANAYADFFRGIERVVAAVQQASEIHLPLIVLGELRAGFAAGGRQEANETNLVSFLNGERVHVLALDEATTHVYAALLHDLRNRGKPIPTNDLWIAALAIQHGLALLTRDRHFEHVRGLLRI